MKSAGPGGSSSGGAASSDGKSPVSPSSAEMRSLIPRVVTPPALRKMYPRYSHKLNFFAHIFKSYVPVLVRRENVPFIGHSVM